MKRIFATLGLVAASTAALVVTAPAAQACQPYTVGGQGPCVGTEEYYVYTPPISVPPTDVCLGSLGCYPVGGTVYSGGGWTVGAPTDVSWCSPSRPC